MKAALLIAVAVAVAVLGCARSGTGRVDPPPARIPYVDVKLPHSVRDYRSYESGMQHTMLQVRFRLDARDLPALEARLPCRLGPLSEGDAEYARVGTNDRSWYDPQSARRHRGCDFHRGLQDGSFLISLDDAANPVVYGVVALE